MSRLHPTPSFPSALVVWLSMVGCVDGGSGGADQDADPGRDTLVDVARPVDGTPRADAATDQGADVAPDAEADAAALPPLSYEDVPCDHPEYWPRSVESEALPVMVHYQAAGDAETAREVLGYVEYSWRVEVEGLGFRAPLPDDGLCGPDGRFDVFLWRGAEESWVDVRASNGETAWDDWIAYMVVDPWGPFGGEQLDVTVAHELNHACQAADDWFDAVIAYEMTATFIEDVVYDDDDSYRALLVDFQSNPDWALDRDDGYETWYMYAASLYLFFLRDRYFEGDASFVAEVWLNTRNSGHEDADNEPDFEDALDAVLGDAAGVSFLESVVEFARWRWYTGARDDGRHFEEGADFPDDAEVRVTAEVAVDEGRVPVWPAPMLLGNAYVALVGAPDARLHVALETPDGGRVRWVVQAVPGLVGESDGETLDLSAGPAPLQLTADGRRTLVITALPAGEDDVDERTDARFPVTVLLSP